MPSPVKEPVPALILVPRYNLQRLLAICLAQGSSLLSDEIGYALYHLDRALTLVEPPEARRIDDLTGPLVQVHTHPDLTS